MNVAATYGRARAGIGAVVSTFFGIGFIALAIWIFIGIKFKYTPISIDGEATVSEVKNCEELPHKDMEMEEYRCDVVYTYKNNTGQNCVGERTITTKFKPHVGEWAPDFVPESSDKCTGGKQPEQKVYNVSKWWGILPLFIGLLIIIVPWIVFYAEMKSKEFAVGMGVVTGIGDVTSAIAAPFTRH